MNVATISTSPATAHIAELVDSLFSNIGRSAPSDQEGVFFVICVDPTSFESGLKAAEFITNSGNYVCLSIFGKPLGQGESVREVDNGPRPFTIETFAEILQRAGAASYEYALQGWWMAHGERISKVPDPTRIFQRISFRWLECHTKTFAEGTHWSAIWPKHAEEELGSLAGVLDDLSSGRVNVQKKQNTLGFWQDVFRKYAVISVVTTNLSFKGSYGRKEDYVAIQAEATRRAVNPLKVTRFFVYNERADNFKEELNNFRSSLTEQIVAGIRVCVISKKRFELRMKRWKPRIGSYDFMVLDSRLVYITKTDNEMTTVESVYLDIDENVLSAAQQAIEDIDEWDHELTLDDVAGFPEKFQEK